MVMDHRGRGCPREVIVQDASEPFVAVEPGILQRLIETGDRSLVHLLVQPVAAVNSNDRRLIAVLLGICCWPTECFGPVRGEALRMLRVESVTECMAHHLILQHPRVPRICQLQYPVKTAS